MARKSKNQLQKIMINLSMDVLDDIIRFLFTDSKKVNRKNVKNLHDFLLIVDPSCYDESDDLKIRVTFLKRFCKGYLKDNLQDKNILLNYCMDCSYEDEINSMICPLILDVPEDEVLSEDEINYIVKYVSDRLQYAYLYNYGTVICDTFDRLMTEDFDSISEINRTLKNQINGLNSSIRKCAVDLNNQENTFDMSDMESYITNITKTWETVTNPGNKLKTPIQYLNKMLSYGEGGFECGRTYLFLGVTGGFKSGLLASIPIWIRDSNLNYKTKDPNKQPAMIYLTLENSISETIQREYLMITGEKLEEAESPEEVMNVFKEYGFHPKSNDNDKNITIIQMYRANRSISTADLYEIIDDCEADGKEIIGIVIDYVSRIRSEERVDDLRIELGNIINEMGVIAKYKDIPVITAAQFNRNTLKIIESAIEANKSDIGKLLNISDTGESALMLNNVDFVCSIYQEYKKINNKDTKWLSFKAGKKRGGKVEITYFAHPFDDDNWLRLKPDLGLKESLSVLQLGSSYSLDTDEDVSNLLNGKKVSKSFKQKMKKVSAFNDIGKQPSNVSNKKQIPAKQEIDEEEDEYDLDDTYDYDE